MQDKKVKRYALDVSEWIDSIHSLRRKHRLRNFPPSDVEYPVAKKSLEESEAYLTTNFTERLLNATAYLPNGVPASPLVAVLDLGGDTHQGCFPLQLTWADNQTWIFKPRSSWSELALRNVLDLIGGSHGYQWPKNNIIPCPQGYWCQVLDGAAPVSPELAAHFYFASGILLAGAYAIRLSDLNHENVIADNGWPQVVDAEFICQPSMACLKAADDAEIQHWFENSVLATLMLPLPGRHSDPSALGNAKGSRCANGRWNPSRHVPRNSQQREYRPVDYLPEILGGFAAGYQNILRSTSKIINIFSEQLNATVRIAIRPTEFYVQQEKWLWRKEAIQMPIADRRDALYRILSNTLTVNSDCTETRFDAKMLGRGYSLRANILRTETEQLLQGDIPIFYAKLNSRDLFTVGLKNLGQAFPYTPLDSLVMHLSDLDIYDADRQIALIKTAMMTTLE